MSFTANFLTELDKLQFKANIVLEINGTYFSSYQVDSGLVVDADKVGLVNNASVSGVTLDIRKAKTPVASLSFQLLDKDEVITTFIMADDRNLQGREVNFYFGFITGSFDFSDYYLMSTTKIKNISKITNAYNFTSRELLDDLVTPLEIRSNLLDGAISDVDTTLDLVDASDFPTSGRIKIDDEFITYTGITDNTLTGLVRADLASTADSHSNGAEVFVVITKNAHPIDIMLDILANDIGVDPTNIDSATFTALRDGEFSGEPNYLLYIYDQDNALNYLEDNLLQTTNTRFLTINGKISLTLLDQMPFDTLENINEDHITRQPSWDISSDKIVNKIIVKYNFNEGTQNYDQIATFTDADSIATFDERKPITLEIKGTSSATVAQDRANRLLARLSTPKAEITLSTHLNRLQINAGDAVRVAHRYLPQQGGALGFNDVLEVMSKSPKNLQKAAEITWRLQFSSYTGVRIGLISPAPRLDLTITNQSTFQVPSVSRYKIGYRVRLWDNINNQYFADPVNTISNISGNFLTMATPWTTTLGSNCTLVFADYADCTGDQRAQFAFIAPDTNIFPSDGAKAYEIIV